MEFAMDPFYPFSDLFNKSRDYVNFRRFLAAAIAGDTAHVANYLNKKPADLNRQETLTGANALMAATMKGSLGTAKLLLDRGASLSGQDKNGFNVLHMAVLSSKEITE